MKTPIMGVSCQDSTSMRQRLNDLHILSVAYLGECSKTQEFLKGTSSKFKNGTLELSPYRTQSLHSSGSQTSEQKTDFNNDFL
jgi:hypothetical protein